MLRWEHFPVVRELLGVQYAKCPQKGILTYPGSQFSCQNVTNFQGDSFQRLAIHFPPFYCSGNGSFRKRFPYSLDGFQEICNAFGCVATSCKSVLEDVVQYVYMSKNLLKELQKVEEAVVNQVMSQAKSFPDGNVIPQCRISSNGIKNGYELLLQFIDAVNEPCLKVPARVTGSWQTPCADLP